MWLDSHLQVVDVTFVDRWLKERKREISDATYAIYEKTAERFLTFLGGDADRELGSVTKSRIVDYRNQLADKLAPATVNRDVKIIRMIFRQARLDSQRRARLDPAPIRSSR